MKIHWASIEHGCFYSNRKRDRMSKRQELRVCENERVCKKDRRQSIYCIDLERYLISFCDISIVPTCSSSKSHFSSHTHTFTQLCPPPPPPPLGIQLSLPPTISVCVFAPPPPSTVDFLSERERVVCNQMTTTDNPAIHPLCPVHLERSERAGVEERNEVKEAGSVWAEGKETRGGSGWYVHVHVCVCVCVCVWREGGCWLICGHEGNRSCLLKATAAQCERKW